MTGSNHCFSNNSDSSRRGENRRTDAASVSTVDIFQRHSLDANRRASHARRAVFRKSRLTLLRKSEAVGAVGVGLIEPDRLRVIFEVPGAGLLAGLQERHRGHHEVMTLFG